MLTFLSRFIIIMFYYFQLYVFTNNRIIIHILQSYTIISYILTTCFLSIIVIITLYIYQAK